MTNKCPSCGADALNIMKYTALTNGPRSLTISRCVNCGYEYEEKDDYVATAILDKMNYKITTRYKELKDWLVENYSTRNDVDMVYSALCEVLDLLDENAMRGIR